MHNMSTPPWRKRSSRKQKTGKKTVAAKQTPFIPYHHTNIRHLNLIRISALDLLHLNNIRNEMLGEYRGLKEGSEAYDKYMYEVYGI